MSHDIKYDMKFSVTLPLFLTRKNKYPVMILASAITFFAYYIPNHYPVFPLHELTMTQWDLAIPFVPHWIWIYMTEIPLFASAFILCKDINNANKYLYSFLALQLISDMIFFFYPTVFPRELFPLPETLDPWTYQVFSQMRQTDAATNCLPSLHVSSTYLASFIFLDDRKKLFPFYFAWASLIAASTLPTKQHYIIDVVVGFLMAIAIYWFFHKVVQYKRKQPSLT